MASAPKASPVKWFKLGEGEANAHELLFFALLLTRNAESVGELREWAKQVLNEKVAAMELNGELAAAAVEALRANGALVQALVARQRARATIVRIGAAMRYWKGTGSHDDLGLIQLLES